ncbi:catabolite control protein B [Lactobacillus selangorensis]|uniref:Catabolite control protein B n=1 Tax=Lactobacillus selangorensis TaxID=81857 RepID=A0A0R2FU27_9LACO|nr:LacI family DNA-binding transcriptional regulator [Lactobacillus selangorensis]KRN28317.1 catabolite control protein B [Lactobacillus selangorensis]
MATIRDVAKYTGHSISTVSRVLNHPDKVALATRQEIEAAMRKLDYHRNEMARELSQGRSHRIGVVLPIADTAYFQKLINAMLLAAFDQQYQVVLLPTHYKESLEYQYLGLLEHHGVEGLIFASRALPLDKIAAYASYGPIVCCEDTTGYPISSVTVDRETSLVQVMQAIQKMGGQRLGLTLDRPESESPSSRLTFEAYRTVFHQEPRPEQIVSNVLYMDDGVQAAGQFFSHKVKPTIILSNGDEIAGGIIGYLKHNHETCAVIGQENMPISWSMDFSTIDNRLDQIGKTAVQMVIDREVRHKKFSARFIPRGDLAKVITGNTERRSFE